MRTYTYKLVEVRDGVAVTLTFGKHRHTEYRKFRGSKDNAMRLAKGWAERRLAEYKAAHIIIHGE